MKKPHKNGSKGKKSLRRRDGSLASMPTVLTEEYMEKHYPASVTSSDGKLTSRRATPQEVRELSGDPELHISFGQRKNWPEATDE